MAKFSGFKSERTELKFRKRKRNFLRCALLLLKQVRELSRAKTAKKGTKKRDARAQLLFC